MSHQHLHLDWETEVAEGQPPPPPYLPTYLPPIFAQSGPVGKLYSPAKDGEAIPWQQVKQAGVDIRLVHANTSVGGLCECLCTPWCPASCLLPPPGLPSSGRRQPSSAGPLFSPGRPWRYIPGFCPAQPKSQTALPSTFQRYHWSS